MANFIGRSGELLLFTQEERGVIVDSALDLIVASGSAEILASSQNWTDGEPTESAIELAAESLSSDEFVVTASAKRLYTIPRGVQNEAKKALQWRKEEKRGGTPVGMNTARTLAKGGQIGIEKIRHIAKYFPRHEVDKQGKGWKVGEDNFPSNGRIAWALWGGDAAWRWAKAIVERENKETITAGAYGFVGNNDATYEEPDTHAFEKAYELDSEYSPEFLTRVRLDGSGMDRLYKIDHDGEVYLWDDGRWDNFGRVGNNIWDYDRELDDEADECGKSHIVVDPESAVIIAARLNSNPHQNVFVEDIDYYESRLAADAADQIDWEFVDRTLTAAGSAPDGTYTEEERSKNASAQLRDKKGTFTKMGGRVMVGGDAQNGMGKITKINADAGTVTVELDNGNTVDVQSKLVESMEESEEQQASAPATPSAPVEPIDVSGILGDSPKQVDNIQATLPKSLPAMTPDELHSLLADYPEWVQQQRTAPKEVGRKKKQTAHPLINRWANKRNTEEQNTTSSWSNPVVAGGDEKALTPETTDVEPIYMAIVDSDDPRAVLNLISLVPASSTSSKPMTYVRKEGKWEADTQTLADLNSATPPPVVPLDETVLNDVLKQVDMAQGVEPEAKDEEPIAASLTLSVLFGPTLIAAGGLDRNRGKAEELRRYWTTGEGAAKIRWGQGGDWKRCVRHLSKYMGVRAKGYCQLRHKEALGYYTSTHAKMERANKAAIGHPSEEDDLTVVTPMDMLTPISQILADEDETFDTNWEPTEDIISLASNPELEEYDAEAVTAAGGLDRNRGNAEKLRKYWTVGKGGAKIRWGTDGDWTRCVRNLSKYLGPRSKGYCALRHKEMNGMWPGDKRNREFAIHASGEALYSDHFLRSEEDILAESQLIAQRRDARARFATIASGMTMPVETFFVKEPVQRTPEMEEIVETEEPVDEQDIKIVDLIPSQETVDMDNVEEVADSEKPVDVLITGDGPVLVDGHHRTVAHEERGEETVPAKIYVADKPVVASGDANEGAPFFIPLVIPEELESGDGRMFKKGAITMRDLPLPLMWQIKTSTGHAGSVVVGRIDRMERTEQGIGNAYGVFDTGEFGQEAERMVRNGFLRGVSADMDKFEAEETSDDAEKSEENTDKIKKDKVLINKARIMGVTIVPKPAFQECSITLVENSDEISQEETVIPDGEYVDEVDPVDAKSVIASALIAGAIPTEPPTEWFDNPQLNQPTPLTVDNHGRVYGHIAAWNVDHIGMVAGTKPPRSRSNYAYFHTGVCRTDNGTDVPVGQLTLAGGHASITADANEAVKHYDDTASAIADIHAGEDQFGIWVAGALRPGTTPEQVRALRASAPSGDWRPIRGRLELVAVCQVNVPGFPIARAMVAGGHITALVAAGAQAIAKLRNNPLDELAQRLDKLESKDREALVAAVADAKSRFDALRPAKAEVAEEAIVADGIYEDVEPHLVSVLEQLLADSVALSFRAQGYHWNVKGGDFVEYHTLFGAIYSDIYSTVDPIAENILKLGYDSPFDITAFAALSPLATSQVESNMCQAMAYDLYTASEYMVTQLKNAFGVADAANEQGIADFIAGRIDAQQKWSWQLKASSVPEEVGVIEEGSHVEPYDMVFSSVEEMPEAEGLVASAGMDRAEMVADYAALLEFAIFTKEQRDELAKEGKALKDGSYPIRNKADLKNAIRAIGRANKSKRSEVRKHIIKRAKALGAADLIPENWKAVTASADDLRARIAEFSAQLEVQEPVVASTPPTVDDLRARIAEFSARGDEGKKA